MVTCDNCKVISQGLTRWDHETLLCSVCTRYYTERATYNAKKKVGFNPKPMKDFKSWIYEYRATLRNWLDEQRATITELEEKIKDVDEYVMFASP